MHTHRRHEDEDAEPREIDGRVHTRWLCTWTACPEREKWLPKSFTAETWNPRSSDGGPFRRTLMMPHWNRPLLGDERLR